MTTKLDLPKRLYKFCPVDIFASDIFCRQVLWFSRPDSFNDPYDCLPILETKIDEEGYRNYLMTAWSELHQTSSPSELARNVEVQMEQSWPLNKASIDRFKEEYQQRLNSLGVFSTSERFDSVVMWSHYANKHKGICLELDPSTLSQNISFLKIKYLSERPVINLFIDYKNANQISVQVKNCEWKYEKEWRIVIATQDNTPQFPCEITLPEGMLTGVIMGERIKCAVRDRVIDWSQHLPTPPKLYKAKLDPDKFRINRVPENSIK